MSALPIPTWTSWTCPEEAGWASEALGEVQALTETLDTDAVMIVQGGRIVRQWGEVEKRLPVHSIRKSFLNALYGIQVEADRIRIGRTLADLGIDDTEGLSERERRATVMDLLMARSGVYHPCGGESPWMTSMREPRGSHGPGTHWVYNNWDFNALGTIYEQETGEDLFASFRDRIAVPLGMEDFRYDDEQQDAVRSEVPMSVHPMFAFRMSARDLARFGLLYLREGRWGDQAILTRDWVRQSVLPYSDAGSNGAYGYLWWVARQGIHWPHVVVPEGTFSARGVGGHRLVVIPALDLVIVHRVDTTVPGREVTATQFGRLLNPLLRAAPAAL